MYLGGGEPNEYEKGLYERAWVEEGKQAAKLAARISELEAEVSSLRDDLDQSLSDRCREETEAFMVEQEHAALKAEVRSLREENAKLGEALEKERARTCRDCGRQLGDPALQVCTGCVATRLRASLTPGEQK